MAVAKYVADKSAFEQKRHNQAADGLLRALAGEGVLYMTEIVAVHLAVPEGAHRPAIDHPPTTVHVFRAATFDLGRIEIRENGGERFWAIVSAPSLTPSACATVSARTRRIARCAATSPSQGRSRRVSRTWRASSGSPRLFARR